MSLHKGIKYGKEKRKPFYGAKAVSHACARGDCPWCRSNKLHKHMKRTVKDPFSVEPSVHLDLD